MASRRYSGAFRVPHAAELSRLNRSRIIAAFATVGAFVVVYLLLPPAPPAVDVDARSMMVDGLTRSYRVAVPHELAENPAVVFAFHGIGDSADSMAAYSELDRLASEQGFVLVYPEGLNAMWSAIDVDPEALDMNPDVRFFDVLLDRINDECAINRNRIYLVGMSNGGSFVQVLANARSADIAAVVSCSGPRPSALHVAPHPFPILLIVGRDDLNSRSMQSDLEYYQTAGHEAELIVVGGLGHEWSVRHNADAWGFMAKHHLRR